MLSHKTPAPSARLRASSPNFHAPTPVPCAPTPRTGTRSRSARAAAAHSANASLTVLRPRPPPKSDGMKLRGVHFLGNRLHFDIQQAHWSVQLAPLPPPASSPSSSAPAASRLQVTGPDGKTTDLTDAPVVFASSQTATITPGP